MPHTVLLVEDDRVTCNRLAECVKTHPHLTLAGTAAGYREARTLLEGLHPDVVLVDLGLPDGDGIDLVRHAIRQPCPPLVMVITVFVDESTVLRAIAAGASGYLVKDEGFERTGDEIMTLLEGGAPISPKIARHLLRRVQQDYRHLPPTEGLQAPTLTEREREILELIAEGYNTAEIASMLKISHNTVNNHIRHIYGKLEVNSRTQAVNEGIQLGIIKIAKP